MIKLVPVALILLLTACSSAPDTQYYQLPVAYSPVASGSVADGDHSAVWVDHISVADYLVGNGVVYQNSDVQYQIASRHLWGSPLDQQLQQTLVAILSQALPTTLVSASPVTERQDRLTVNVTGFHGRYDGKAIISGDWQLQRRGRIIKHNFALALPQHEDGYDALVRTLAAGWQRQAQDIANAIRSNQ